MTERRPNLVLHARAMGEYTQATPTSRTNHARAERRCQRCNARLRQGNLSGYCAPCQQHQPTLVDERIPYQPPPAPRCACGKPREPYHQHDTHGHITATWYRSTCSACRRRRAKQRAA